MAFVVSDLPDWKEINREQIIRKAVLGGNFVQRMTKQTGIKKDALLNYLDVVPTLADGSSCGFSAAGDDTFTQRTISTAKIKVNKSWCPETLIGKYTEYRVRISANAEAEALPFWDEILGQILEKLNAKQEKAIFQGSTSSSDTDLKWYNGLITLALADSSVIDVTINNGTSAFDAIKAVYMAIPEVMLETAEIYVNPSLFRQFMAELVERNYYHYGAAEGNVNEFIFPGTNTKVVKVAGLTGASYIFAADPKELFYGCDLENAMEDARLWFSDDDDLFKLKILWNAGVQYAFGDHIVLGAYGTITSPDGGNAALAAIATNTGTIATNTGTVATNVAELADDDHIYKTQEQSSEVAG